MADSPHQTKIELEYNDEHTAQIVRRSLQEEIGEIDDDRSETMLTLTKQKVTLQINATDLVAQRAALNTWLSLVTVAEKSITVANDYGPR